VNKDKTLKLVRKIVESYIDPSSNTDDQQFNVNKLEEQFSVNWIKTKFLPAYIKHFNEVYKNTWARAIIHNIGVEYDKERWGGRFSQPIEDSIDLIKNLKKIKDDNRGSFGTRNLVYFTKSSNGAEFLFRIEKSSPHIVRVNFLNPWKDGYMGYELKPGGYPADKFSFGKVEENTSAKYNPEYNISKEEEGYAFEFIKRNRIPVVVDSFNEFVPSVDNEVTEMEIRRNLKKVEHERNDGISDKIVYSSTVRGNTFSFDLRKTWGGRMLAGAASPMGGSIRDVYVQGGGIQFHDISENIQQRISNIQPKDFLTKEDQLRSIQFIRDMIKRSYGTKTTPKSLRRVEDKIPPAPNAMRFKSDPEEGDFNFRVVKMDGKISILDDTLAHCEVGWHGKWYSLGDTTALLKENETNPNLTITKEDHLKALNFINLLIRRSTGFSDKELKRVSPLRPNTIRYTSEKSHIDFTIYKKEGEVRVENNSCYADGCNNDWSLDYQGSMFENLKSSKSIKEHKTNPKYTITKEEEGRGLEFIRKILVDKCVQVANNGMYPNISVEEVRKSLKKTDHTEGVESYDSDWIDFSTQVKHYRLNFFLRKGARGRLVAGFKDPHNRWTPTMYYVATGTKVTLNENAPTGDWESWETITQPEKDRLKVVLKQYQDYIKNIYHPNLSAQKLHIIQKCIDNLDVTDPRYSAKPLAQLPMEMRLSMMDWVDHKDTTGQASKVMDFLMDISRNYIEPPKPPKSDIELKGITDIVWPGGRSKGNVSIHGIEDMRPVINFGYGPYTLDDEFIEQFSKPGAQLYLDFGQGVKVVNMSQVMAKVKDALEKHKKSLTEGKFTDSENYQKAIIHVTNLHNFTKQEEEFVFQILKNKIVDGERLGKTLKKIYHRVAQNPSDYARMDFTATIKGKEKIYRVVKTQDSKRAVVRDSSMDGDFKNFVIPLNENSEKKVVLSKEDEQRAVQFISNLVYGGQRLGKTLKKIKIDLSDNPLRSNGVIYSAKVDNVNVEFEIFRSWRRGVVAIDTITYFTYVIDDPGLI